MSSWQDFLDEESGNSDKPGKVMICFVNRYLEGVDGIKYKIKYNCHERSGTTTPQDYCIEISPDSLEPIHTFVWSRQARTYKKLDDVVAKLGRKKLVRKVLKTFKTQAKTDKLPDQSTGKRPDKPTPAPTSAPSPTDPQGIKPEQTKNESNQPQARPERPVPNEITIEQLKKIFPAAKNDYLKQIADECNKDLTKYHLDTPYRKMHFFAQIKGETGPAMKPVTESWEYSPEFLIGNFSYYKKHPDEAKQDGYTRGPSYKDKHGKLRKGKITHHANQTAIGEKHFAKLNGNRVDHPEDGYNFRGRGLIQITGYKKYYKFNEEYSKYFDGKPPDSINNPDVINQSPYAIQSAIWFWLYQKVYLEADLNHGAKDVRLVSLKINGGAIGLKAREEAFKISEAAFK